MKVSDALRRQAELTPLVVRGSEGGTRLLNSPWALVMASGFLLADMMKGR